jgi:hypothetical protein
MPPFQGESVVQDMKTALLLVVTALLAASGGGCGTVCNLAGGVVHPDSEPRIYGGVLRDMQIMDEAVSCKRPLIENPGDPRAMAFFLGLAAADPILSFLGDTLTLPITIPLQARRTAASKSDQEGGPMIDSPARPNNSSGD